MKRTRPSEIKALLSELDLRPSRTLGQNFLVDENILNIILDSARVTSSDRVLEIGPGLGTLTEPLLERAGHVIAIEKDPRLAAYIRDTFGSHDHFELIEADALDLNLPDLLRERQISQLVSNLPYSAGTRILMELFDVPARPRRMVVTLQLDVGERLAAQPGTKEYGIASIMAQLYYDVCIRKVISPTCFYPPPDVRSAIVELFRKDEPAAPISDNDYLRGLLRWCFSRRRKQMGSILDEAPAHLRGDGRSWARRVQASGLDLRRRPETLSPVEWILLANHLGAHN